MRTKLFAVIFAVALATAITVEPLAPTPAFSHETGSKDNLTLLARVVSAEAKGEPYEGQVAVAAVILNRVDSPKFPNSVAGVVYEPHAFESVSNGTIWQPVCETCWKAAKDALNGWDPSYGSLFFFNPAKTRNRYIWSRPQVRKIGNHIFAK